MPSIDRCRLAASLLALALLAPAAPLAAQTGEGRRGEVVEAPRNLRSFSPDEAVGIVPARSVNLAAVFEGLGDDATLWYQHVITLSNPYFEGRGPDSPGGARAADYVRWHLQHLGLEPAFPAESDEPGGATMAAASWTQPFDFGNPSPEVHVRRAEMAINGAALEDGTDYVVLGNTGDGSVTAPVAFVGYGIEDGPDGYSSFDEDTDLRDRIALLLRYEPLDEEGRSRWSDRRFSPQAGLARKIGAVADRGAAGILLVNPPGAVDGRVGLETLESSARFGRSPGVPVMQISPETADRLLAADPQGRDLAAWRALADEGTVKTAVLGESTRVTMITEVDRDDRLETSNVGGILRGRGDLADQWIVIGGHYDHVGYGYTGTRPNNAGQLHPGADDNASGTAGVLVLAKRLAEAYAQAGDDASMRSVLFLAFGAEEAGLHGSRYFVSHPTIPAESISAMINMDMIGRLRDDNLSVGGTGTAEQFEDVLTPIFLESGLRISESPGGRGPSDHANFYGAGIPVLFLFTGLHDRYHAPTDYGWTVNPAGAIKVIDLAERIARTLAESPDQMTYVASAGGGDPGRRTGSRVRLGIMPAYGADLETGVLVEQVFEGASAAEAGMQDGDVITSWNGEEVTGGARLMELLRDVNPGDLVRVDVDRGGTTVSLNVVMQAREDG